MEQSKVALVRCDSYEQEKVEAAIRQAIDLLGGFEQIFAAAKEKNAALCEAAKINHGISAGSAAEPVKDQSDRPAVSFAGEQEMLAEDEREEKGIDGKPGAVTNQAAEMSRECSASLNKESQFVLKPNLLAKTPPEKACTTHPAVFQAVGGLLQEAGYTNLKYGDSPGNPMVKVEKVAEGCGIKAAADALGIPIGDFEHGIRVDFPQGRAADHFIVCSEAVAADGIINICKMKTHQLERITGAVKNTFGCVFGVNKASSHARFATAETFAKMIADLNRLVSPVLHIMDGIVAMEGNGPQGGTPKAMNVILASTDPVAVDGLFCHLVHLNPKLVPTNVAAMEQGVGSYENFQVVTAAGVLTAEEAAERYGDKTFRVQRDKEYRGKLQAVRFLAPFLEKKPIVQTGACVGCGICVQACPVEGKAIRLEENVVPFKANGESAADGAGKRPAAGKGMQTAAGSSASGDCRDCPSDCEDSLTGGKNCSPDGGSRRIAQYDYSKCIKCYCCQEMCPQDAITVKKSLLARLADRNWRI